MTHEPKPTLGNANRWVPVSTAAALLHAGDEKQVWADVASGKLNARSLVEADDCRNWMEPIRRTTALRFMAGDNEHHEVRQLNRVPLRNMDGTVVFVNGFKEVRVVTKAAFVTIEVQACGETAPTRSWPWGAHETKLLSDLAAAADRFWKNYDPTDQTTAPKNDDVSGWLQSERAVSKRVAEVMAQILRADGLPTGPRK